VYKIGIDLGGTKTEGILLDDSLNVIQRTRISTPRNKRVHRGMSSID